MMMLSFFDMSRKNDFSLDRHNPKRRNEMTVFFNLLMSAMAAGNIFIGLYNLTDNPAASVSLACDIFITILAVKMPIG